MEGVGSRPCRASTRHGHHSSSSATFTGPVRRWEKKWVHVASPSPFHPNSTRRNSHHVHQKNSKITKPGTGILLCKWTPLSRPTTTSTDGGDKNSGMLEPSPSKRKFRYTPISVFEEQKKKAAKKIEEEVKSGETDQSKEMTTLDCDDFYGMLNLNPGLMGSHQAVFLQADSDGFLTTHCSSKSGLNFNMFWKGHTDDLDLDLLHKEGLADPMNQSGFWTTG